MKQTINFSDFTAAFHRADRGNQFSYDALRVLFDYLENFEEDTGEEIELDVIGLCCEFSELDADEVIASYPTLFDADEIAEMSEEDVLQCVADTLNDETMFCGITSSNTFVFQSF